ncbi:hypothetical protein E2C01_054078 [Portunus trituberculatus]|uniref:Uncharacterized protein n=1 Tax=Portunus trituberculatus TaxID=210409 RepID=A0A5B7GQY7_PORTR|nr:hypothetical protein [Portunus trituberculatus]
MIVVFLGRTLQHNTHTATQANTSLTPSHIFINHYYKLTFSLSTHPSALLHSATQLHTA